MNVGKSLSAEKLPLVSIGFPVYNAGRYIREALDGLLGQDYQNIELIISDNASTDGTFEVCEEYAARDARIRLHRNDINMGSSKNVMRVFDLSRGDYFMWAAHDDQWDRTYVRKCVEMLERNPDAVLCCSELHFINEDGSVRWEWPYVNFETAGKSVAERFQDFASRMGWFAIYGLIRPQFLRQIPPFGDKFGADVVFFLELFLLGDVVKVPETLFYYRFPDKPKSVQQYLEALNPMNRSSVTKRPYTDLARGLLKVIARSQLDPTQKQQLEMDFVEILAFRNLGWRAELVKENPAKFAGASEADCYAIVQLLLFPERFKEQLPESRKVNIVAYALNDEQVVSCLLKYVEAFAPEDAIGLYVLAGHELERLQPLVIQALEAGGYDSDLVPDITLLDQPDHSDDVHGFLNAATMVLGAPEVLALASELGVSGFDVDSEAWIETARKRLAE